MNVIFIVFVAAIADAKSGKVNGAPAISKYFTFVNAFLDSPIWKFLYLLNESFAVKSAVPYNGNPFNWFKVKEYWLILSLTEFLNL